MDHSMESLSHWDYTDEFSGKVAAALILGVDPNNLESVTTAQDRIGVVSERMHLNYEHALKRRYHEAFNIYPEDPQEIDTNLPQELVSVKLNNLHTHWASNEDQSTFTDWLLDDLATSFESQKFSRNTLADWIDAMQLKSIYQFRLGTTHTGTDPLNKWPWGNHHTENLGHLEAAAKRYWTNYDPSDPTTASTNEEIAEWLRESRGVSKNMADSIASILRADGLRTGPRK